MIAFVFDFKIVFKNQRCKQADCAGIIHFFKMKCHCPHPTICIFQLIAFWDEDFQFIIALLEAREPFRVIAFV